MFRTVRMAGNKIPRPLHCCSEQGILKGRISIQFIFGTVILWPFPQRLFKNFKNIIKSSIFPFALRPHTLIKTE